jgi:hypothetical protein
MSHENLLDGPAPTLLPAEGADADARAALASGATLQAAAAAAPSASLPGEPVAAYAYARTGYHRGLDALRRAGWRGRGPIPADHLPNQGFLRALLALAEAADAIGEQDEADRCAQFLVDSGTSSEQVAGLR